MSLDISPARPKRAPLPTARPATKAAHANTVSKTPAGEVRQGQQPQSKQAQSAESPSSQQVDATPEQNKNPQNSGDFESRIRQILAPDQKGRVHEEELFAAIAYERVHTLAGPEAGRQYFDALAATLRDKPDGSVEQAAISALRGLAAKGGLSAELADRVYSQAFAAAQLDDKADALFDGKGGGSDPTIAVADFEAALAGAAAKIAAFESGTEAAPERKLADAAPTGAKYLPRTRGAGRKGDKTGNPVDGPDGFLWKPVSESDGNLVVLLPRELAGDVASVIVRGPGGEVLAEGRATGLANGGREHFRFDRPGGAFPASITVSIRLEDGTLREYRIPHPAQRYD